MQEKRKDIFNSEIEINSPEDLIEFWLLYFQEDFGLNFSFNIKKDPNLPKELFIKDILDFSFTKDDLNEDEDKVLDIYFNFPYDSITDLMIHQFKFIYEIAYNFYLLVLFKYRGLTNEGFNPTRNENYFKQESVILAETYADCFLYSTLNKLDQLYIDKYDAYGRVDINLKKERLEEIKEDNGFNFE